MNSHKLKSTLALMALAGFGALPLQARATIQEPPAGFASLVFDQCSNTYTATWLCGEGAPCPSFDSLPGKIDTMGPVSQENGVCTVSWTGSAIDNATFNHRHFGTDYAATKDSGSTGCTSCGQSSTKTTPNGYAKVAVQRTQSLREITQPSSFGPGVFMNYDVTLTLFEINGATYIDAFNPAWLGIRRYSPSGTEFKDTIYGSIRTVRLYDAAGNKTSSRAAAVRAEIIGKTGDTLKFELFDLDANRKGGRLVATTDAAGTQVLGFTYATPVADAAAAPESKWLKSGASDLSGDTLTYTYATHATGRSVLTRVAIPGGRLINYSYDDQGNLARVDYPNGDASTFVRSVDNGALKIVMNEAGASGMHRNKTAWYSNNIATALLNWDNNTRPVMYNQASQLVHAIRNGSNELTYAAVSGAGNSAMHRKIYEGGGRLKFIDTAEKSSYKSWSIPNGISSADPFGSIVASREKNGHLSPYWEYAANRAGTPGSVTVPESPSYAYKYDANGNLTHTLLGDKSRWRASDARVNKPILETDFDGKTVLRAYDAAGNLVSEKKGYVLDKALGAGVETAGLACAFYAGASLNFAELPALTPTGVIGVHTIASGFKSKDASNALRLTGKLVIDTAGPRTFYASSQYYQMRVVIDGVTVLSPYYTEGERSVTVNLTAGAHDIAIEKVGGAYDFFVAWSGPETVVNGTPVKSAIDSKYLRHTTTAEELTVHATPAATEQTWEYHPAGSALAGLMKSATDAAGKRTEYEYDSNRRLVAVKETADTGGALVTVETRAYDAAGNLAAKSDALGRTVSYAYDARNRLTKTTYGDATTETVTYGTGIDANLVVAQKDRAGAVTKFEYDASGRRIKTLAGYALADNDGAITQVLDKPSVEITEYLNGTTDPLRVTRDGKVTEYDYDYKGRVVATRSFPSANKTLVSTTVYNADEVRFCETDPHGCRSFYAYRRPDMAVIRELREIVPGALGTLADEAAVLAVARATGPNPGYAVTDYTKDGDGRTLATTDAAGIVTTTAYDAAARVTATTAAAGTPVAVTTTNTYDAKGRLVAQTDPLGRTTTRAYTDAGRVAAVVYADGTQEQFTYFADGRVATRRDAANQTWKQFWTACCAREAGAANPDGHGQLKFYDGLGRVTFAAAVKNLETVKDFGPNLPADAVLGAVTSKYDARGRLVATTKWLVAPTGVDPKNPPIATDAAQGSTTRYEYLDDLADARLAPILAKLAEKSIVLTAGSATLVTAPTGETSVSVADGAGRTVFTGVIKIN